MNDLDAKDDIARVDRTFRLTVGNGAVVMMGTAFFAAETVLAGLTESLTKSSLLVGLLITVRNVGWMWPQLFVSHVLETRQRKMPAYVISACCRFVALLVMSAAVLFWCGSPRALYWILLFIVAFISSAGGIAVIPFMDIVAKSIPRKRMPLLWAHRRLFGGILGFLASLMIACVLSERSGIPYPANYALLFLAAAILCGAAFLMFVAVQEPIEPVSSFRAPFMVYLRRGPAIFRADHDYRRLYVYRCTWGLATMSQAVYVPCAVHYFQAPPALTGGWFTSVVLLAGGLSSYVWGRAALRHGEVATLRLSAGLLLVSPLTAFALTAMCHYGPTAPYAEAYYLPAYLFMYACGTAAVTGYIIASQAYLLALPPSEYRPTYLAFINTLTIPLLFAPTLAGFLVERISYPATFGLSCVAALASLAVAKRLRSRKEGEYPELDFSPAEEGATSGSGPIPK